MIDGVLGTVAAAAGAWVPLRERVSRRLAELVGVHSGLAAIREAPGEVARQCRLPIFVLRSQAWRELHSRSPLAAYVYLVLRAHRDERTGRAWPGQRTIARLVAATEASVSAAVCLLEDRGWLRIFKSKNFERKNGVERKNRYTVLWPAEVEEADQAWQAGRPHPLVEDDDVYGAGDDRRVRSAIVDIRTLASPELAVLGRSGQALTVWLGLLAFSAGGAREPKVSHHHLAAQFGLEARARSSEAVQRAFGLGLVEVEAEAGRCNRYRLRPPASVRELLPVAAAPAAPSPASSEAAPSVSTGPRGWVDGEWQSCPACGATEGWTAQGVQLWCGCGVHSLAPIQVRAWRLVHDWVTFALAASERPRRSQRDPLPAEVEHAIGLIETWPPDRGDLYVALRDERRRGMVYLHTAFPWPQPT